MIILKFLRTHQMSIVPPQRSSAVGQISGFFISITAFLSEIEAFKTAYVVDDTMARFISDD